jgi:hypothetical protein
MLVPLWQKFASWSLVQLHMSSEESSPIMIAVVSCNWWTGVVARVLKTAKAVFALCALAGCGCPPGTPPASPPALDAGDNPESHASDWNEAQSIGDPQEAK